MKKIKLFYLAVVLAVTGITSSYAQSTVKDIDGNVYNTVKIGNQLWLKENLKVTKLNDGTPISTSNETQKLAYPDFIDIIEPRAWVYKEDPKNNEKYGKLYNWYAVNTGKLCPKGWRIPTIKEWEDLQKFLGWKEASRMMRTADWKGAKTIGTNQSGFTALPAGFAQSGGNYFSAGEQAYFWSSSPGLSSEHYADESGAAIYLFTDNEDACPKSGSIMPVNRYKRSGLSCRCIADNPNATTYVKQENTVAPTKATCEAKDAVMKYKASMIPGDFLSENEKLLSVNDRYQLRVTTDGNFVIEEVLNDSKCQFKEIYRFPLTNGGSVPKTSFFSFNTDGNVCMDSKQGKTYCATTGRDAKAAAILSKELKLLELTNTGQLRIVNGNGKQIWSAN